jgi:hypothetical protein
MKSAIQIVVLGLSLFLPFGACAPASAVQKSPRVTIKYGPFNVPAAAAGKGVSSAMPTVSDIKLPYDSNRQLLSQY